MPEIFFFYLYCSTKIELTISIFNNSMKLLPVKFGFEWLFFLWCLGLDLTKPDIDVFVAGSLLSTRKISLNDVIITVMREFRTGVVLFKVCLMPLPLKSCNCPQPLLNPAIDTDTAVKLSLHKNELYFPYLIPFLPSFEIWLNKRVVSDHIGQKCNFFSLFM